jgi:acyl-CoA thioester hydrolase
MTQPRSVDGPLAGWFEGAIHYLPLRIYYEDTDASGLVYHANYLRYMERARSDVTRLLGFDQKEMLSHSEHERLFFAVRAIEIDYLKPARLDDAVMMETRHTAISAVQGRVRQRLWRGQDLLIDARVHAAFLGGDGRPRRMPAPMREAFEALVVGDV